MFAPDSCLQCLDILLPKQTFLAGGVVHIGAGTEVPVKLTENYEQFHVKPLTSHDMVTSLVFRFHGGPATWLSDETASDPNQRAGPPEAAESSRDETDGDDL